MRYREEQRFFRLELAEEENVRAESSAYYFRPITFFSDYGFSVWLPMVWIHGIFVSNDCYLRYPFFESWLLARKLAGCYWNSWI